jgi:hypothetical protein
LLWVYVHAGEINVALYDAHYFGLMVREHRMEAIECVCLPRQYVWLEKKHFVLELDLDVLRPMVRRISTPTITSHHTQRTERGL